MKMCALLVGAIIGALAAQGSLVRDIPKSGPIGWEKKVTPGFDPPIEYVLVFETDWLDPRPAPEELWKKWGPGAAPVLEKLYHDPAWAELQRPILQLLATSSDPTVAEFFAQELVTTSALPNPTEEISAKVRQLLWFIQKLDPKRAGKLIEDGLRDPRSPHFQTFANSLQVLAAQRDNEDAKAQLDKLLNSLAEDNPLRKSIVYSITYNKTIQRADEPMDLILKKEKGGKP